MIALYTSCPQRWEGESPKDYQRAVLDVAAWTQEAGFDGILTFTDSRSLDPWALAQLIISHTDTIAPLVAVNPVYMHPISAARMINTVGYLFGRTVHLNMVSGGFGRHLREIGSSLDHDQRCQRLGEYAEVLRRLLTEERPVSYDGTYYMLKTARLSPRIAPALVPRFFVSGTSEASRQIQAELGATRLAYPQDPSKYGEGAPLEGSGVGFGIITRESAEEAWRVARDRFPGDSRGEELHDRTAKQVESKWHQDLADDASRSTADTDAYWLYPFRSSRTFNPYLVGSYEKVGAVLERYFALGVNTIVLDGLLQQEDLQHAALLFRAIGSSTWN